MGDYYQVLGLKPSCSQKDIKKAFRDLAKRLHPDLSGGGADASRMRALLEAYETLSDPEQRKEYDNRHRSAFESFSWDYRSFLKSRPGDPSSMAKLIFYDLLHGEEEEALDVFDSWKGVPDFSLERLLDREDAMDGSFLLAEEYEKRGRYADAFERYAWCVGAERKKAYFRHFFPEVELRIKELVRVRLVREVGEEGLLSYLDRLAAMGFPKKETARFYRHKAEINLRLGRTEAARADLEAGLALDRRLSGIRHLRSWTGLD